MIKQILFIGFLLSFCAFSQIQAQNPLILGTYNKKVAAKETVCVPIYGRDFNQIVSIQYSLKWNPAHLKFKEVQSFELPSLAKQNFGSKQVSAGILTFAWYDPQLRGISRLDGAVLYEVCFEVVSPKATTTYLEFVSEPTLIEVSNAAGVLIDLKTEGGKVEIR